MHTGSVILLSLVIATLVWFGVFYITAMIHQHFFPPVEVVNGIDHPVMPVGNLLFGLFCGTLAAIAAFRFTYRRLDEL